jgi:hypothetical protein
LPIFVVRFIFPPNVLCLVFIRPVLYRGGRRCNNQIKVAAVVAAAAEVPAIVTEMMAAAAAVAAVMAKEMANPNN